MPEPFARREPTSRSARILIVMGVSGSGKSVVGRALARRLDLPFLDGDDLHPPGNLAKMRAGHPLDDTDRSAWLDAIAERIDRQLASGQGCVVACSALKRAYRERLVRAREAVRIVFLDGAPALIADRLGARRGHFMPPALLGSQLAALERPEPDEEAIRVGIDASPEAIAGAIMERLGQGA